MLAWVVIAQRQHAESWFCRRDQACRRMIEERPLAAPADRETLTNESYRQLAEQHILFLQDQLEGDVALLRRHKQKLLQEAGIHSAL